MTNKKQRGPISRFFGFLWRALDRLRQIVQLLLLLFVIALIVAALSVEAVKVPDTAALVLEPRGVLVEQLSGDPVERALAELQGLDLRETRVGDLVDALDAAADDQRIRAVVLDLDKLEGGGLPKLQAVAAAVDRVRDSGKPVIAMADSYTQDQYFLAAHADEVYLHPFGSIYVDGYGYYRAYFRDALDKLYVDINEFVVGEYKSFLDPFIRNDMSDADKESAQRWLDGLWQAWQDDVLAARELEPGSLDAYVAGFADRVEAARGDMATVAADAGLVDSLMSRREFDTYMTQMVGAGNDEQGGFSAIGHARYLAALDGQASKQEPKDANVGLLIASGEIVPGKGPPGTVAADTLAAMVRQAAEDNRVDALVLRVDSPGGGMFASEVMREELAALSAAGKPLIVSMSSVAASGGYYIAMPADEIWAAPTTITGSIGVGALLPTFQRSLSQLGVNVDGIGTTSLSGQLALERELGPDVRRVLQASVEEAYREFVDRVAAARGMTTERAESLARGRVWIGSDALDLGLVDRLGGLDEAIESAAAMAGLGEGRYGVLPIEPQLSFRERLALSFATRLRGLLRLEGQGAALPAELAGLAAELGREWRLLSRLSDPRGLYFYCRCDLR